MYKRFFEVSNLLHPFYNATVISNCFIIVGRFPPLPSVEYNNTVRKD